MKTILQRLPVVLKILSTWYFKQKFEYKAVYISGHPELASKCPCILIIDKNSDELLLNTNTARYTIKREIIRGISKGGIINDSADSVIELSVEYNKKRLDIILDMGDNIREIYFVLSKYIFG